MVTKMMIHLSVVLLAAALHSQQSQVIPAKVLAFQCDVGMPNVLVNVQSLPKAINCSPKRGLQIIILPGKRRRAVLGSCMNLMSST